MGANRRDTLQRARDPDPEELTLNRTAIEYSPVVGR